MTAKKRIVKKRQNWSLEAHPSDETFRVKDLVGLGFPTRVVMTWMSWKTAPSLTWDEDVLVFSWNERGYERIYEFSPAKAEPSNFVRPLQRKRRIVKKADLRPLQQRRRVVKKRP